MEVWTDNEQKFLDMMKKTRDYNALKELADKLKVSVVKRGNFPIILFTVTPLRIRKSFTFVTVTNKCRV